MHLGAVLVLIGTILAAISLVSDRAHEVHIRPGLLLTLGVVLIGAGVLIGDTVLTTS